MVQFINQRLALEYSEVDFSDVSDYDDCDLQAWFIHMASVFRYISVLLFGMLDSLLHQ